MFKITLQHYEAVCSLLDKKEISYKINFNNKFAEFTGFIDDYYETQAEEMSRQLLGDIIFYKSKNKKSLKEYLFDK